MTAEVIDLTQYRQGKNGNAEYFQFHEDEDILRRIKMLTWVAEDDWAAEGTPAHGLAFPKGYDPINHPEDSLETVTREAERRGII